MLREDRGRGRKGVVERGTDREEGKELWGGGQMGRKEGSWMQERLEEEDVKGNSLGFPTKDVLAV